MVCFTYRYNANFAFVIVSSMTECQSPQANSSTTEIFFRYAKIAKKESIN